MYINLIKDITSDFMHDYEGASRVTVKERQE